MFHTLKTTRSTLKLGTARRMLASRRKCVCMRQKMKWKQNKNRLTRKLNNCFNNTNIVTILSVPPKDETSWQSKQSIWMMQSIHHGITITSFISIILQQSNERTEKNNRTNKWHSGEKLAASHTWWTQVNLSSVNLRLFQF